MVDMQFDASLPMTETEGDARPAAAISVELIAYAALVALALVLRFAQLDTIPLFASETHNALAAWRVIMPNAPGEPLISSSPILFTLQSISFSLFGGSEIASRVATVLGSLLLILSPALFRPLIGRGRAFAISLLLALSPVLLLASRSSSADVWALLFAVLGLWGYWRAAEMGTRYAVAAVILFAALLFLVGAGGVGLSLVLLVAAVAAYQWRRAQLTEGDDDLNSPSLDAVRRSLGTSLPLALLVVLAVATGFMIHPAGLSSVGEAIGGAVRAVIQPTTNGGYGALIALFYEPFLWVLAIVGFVSRRDRLTVADIFLGAWVLVGVLVSLVFGDGLPGHALWLTVPLAALAANTLVWALTPDDRIGFIAPPPNARWIVALCEIGVLGVFTLSFQEVARSMVQAATPSLTMITPPSDNIVLVLISMLFFVLGYFLFASLWGNRTTWQGVVLGLLIFGGVTSLGAGWNAAAPQSETPAAYWHMKATSNDTALLRTTLSDVSARITGDWPDLEIAVMAPQDGALAWVLRDYGKTRYINNLADAAGAEVVLLPLGYEQPDLGAAYLGQKFTISRTWDDTGIAVIDIPAWWMQTRTRVPWVITDEYALWLRQDVYEGVLAEQVVG